MIFQDDEMTESESDSSEEEDRGEGPSSVCGGGGEGEEYLSSSSLRLKLSESSIGDAFLIAGDCLVVSLEGRRSDLWVASVSFSSGQMVTILSGLHLKKV